jgi:hypothetical protein
MFEVQEIYLDLFAVKNFINDDKLKKWLKLNVI